MTAATALDRESLLQQARSLRGERRVDEALALLDRLEAEHPRFSRLHQERARCHAQRGDAPAAVAALRHALALNPALPAAWEMLHRLHRIQGQTADANAAAERLATLRRLPDRLVAANSLYADGDLQPAEQALRDHLREDPANVGALRLLARICAGQGETGEAIAQLEALLLQAPDYDDARLDYALLLLQDQQPSRARGEAEKLLARKPADRDGLKACAAACIALGEDAVVVDLCSTLLQGSAESGAETADLRLWRANSLKALGRRDEAVVDYQASLTARPDNGVAWFSLSNLKTYAFDDDEIARMEAAERRHGTQDADRVYLRFALGRALEERGDYPASWRHYAGANALRRSSARHRPEAAQACASRLRETLTAGAFARRADWGEPDPAPIFVLGLPRSGSTLVEQILASHSCVEGAQELARIERYAGELCGRDPHDGLPLEPAALLDLTPERARALGARFLAETRPYRRFGRPHFIDKTPDNFWHVGLIHLILPKARIIDVRREPMACGFSLYKQLFATSTQEYSYALDDIARQYRAYLDVMAHWNAVLPGRVLTVHYEDLIEGLESQVRRMLGHCGLAFEPACLAFHATVRNVRTPSSEQVRRPINREGLQQWRHYAPWLEPLRDAMGDALTRYKA